LTGSIAIRIILVAYLRAFSAVASSAEFIFFIAAKDPDKLKEMQAAFLTEAVKYNVSCGAE